MGERETTGNVAGDTTYRWTIWNVLAIFGPGLAVAASGIGAGDVTVTALGGARFGLILLWVPILAGVLKYALNEAMARWQIATGQTLLEGWSERLGAWARIAFALYLVVWTISVFGSIASVSGTTANALLRLEHLAPALEQRLLVGGPTLAVILLAMLQVALCVGLVWRGGYRIFELVMSVLVTFMVVVSVSAAIALWPPWGVLMRVFSGPWLPAGSMPTVLAVLGGVGATVGLMAYSYWILERGRTTAADLGIVRVDLTACYLLTTLFGLAMIILPADETGTPIETILGEHEVTKLKLTETYQVVRYRLEHDTGLPPRVGNWLSQGFAIALWATAFSSLLGLLQSIPSMLSDVEALVRRVLADQRKAMVRQNSPTYRKYLLLIALIPLPLMAWKQPESLVLLYAVWGSLFMPALAGTLLYMNNRNDWVGAFRNRWVSNALLSLCVLLFGWAVVTETWDALFR